ncbi:MFS transporter [Picrophilus oshimae]|uniref:Predicted arabinose efflux permease, MFS family n=1 Tax=Picrophilus torridus (strain ATCC 700027 / DSM 9790 / JCM 10055 / NBRC 100828 / KAW 2/3) TaxID=1122961 RepID=Q6L1L5_PICTO|nr:MFS transporter [Picrophilus oshimae]AAT43137.1 transporter [Picrophilus oshimae DSM 9789]SMD30555.1 Predicted arabinose efflux permease, MFS family [Picrophilus oshimae DSM 9789]
MDRSRLSIYSSFVYAISIILVITISVRSSNNMIMTDISLFGRYVLNFSQFQVGLLESVLAFGTFFTTAFINSRAGTHTRRYLFISANIGYTIMLALIHFSSYLTIWPVILISGFSFGLIMPNIITAASLFPDRRTRERVLGIYTISLSISLILGPSIASYILKYFPIGDAFFFFIPFGIASTVLSPFLKFPDEKRSNVSTRVFSNPGFMAAVFGILSYNIIFALLTAFGGIFARSDLHVSLSVANAIFALFFLFSFASRLYMSFRPPSNLWHYLGTAMMITFMGSILIFLSSDLIIYLIAYIILGIPHGVTYPTSIISISRSFDESSRNLANSYFFSVMMSIGIVMPVLGGFIIKYIGFRTLFIYIAPLIIILMALTFITFKRIPNISATSN